MHEITYIPKCNFDKFQIKYLKLHIPQNVILINFKWNIRNYIYPKM